MEEEIQPNQDMEVEDAIAALEARLQQLQERRIQTQRALDEAIQNILKIADSRFLLYVEQADLALGQERAHFVYNQVAESFRSDIYMRSDECIWTFLRRLTVEFLEQKVRGFDETDNRRFQETCNVFYKIKMFLTEQERIDMIIDMEEEY